MKKQINFEFEEFGDISQLESADRQLLTQAINATNLAYSPYSHFKVGCAGITNNGHTVLGSNQENASYSVTSCGERTLLTHLSVQYPDEYLSTLAVSCIHPDGSNNNPVSPCGVCRQALLEHEINAKKPIRLILGGDTGPIRIIHSVSGLLPLAFNGSDSGRGVTITNWTVDL